MIYRPMRLDDRSDAVIDRFRQLKKRQGQTHAAVRLADATLSQLETDIALQGRLTLTPEQRSELDDARELSSTTRKWAAEVDAAICSLVQSRQPMLDPAEPVLVRITAPAGANVGRQFRPAGSVVLADALEAVALLGGGIASPVPE